MTEQSKLQEKKQEVEHPFLEKISIHEWIPDVEVFESIDRFMEAVGKDKGPEQWHKKK